MADVSEPPAAATDVERRIVSVLFADLVGFTPLSERLDSEDVATIQDAYFGATRDTIARYGGVVEKFIGDAAMAVFGAPRSRDDDAERAVRAGLALMGAVEQLNARLGLEPDALQLRVGVNTGEVVHATAGADAGRVTGDTVNTAARFQAAARPGSVLIGELTALTVAETIEAVAVGEIELKGKADPVRAWEATGARHRPSREEALGSLRAPTLGRETELEQLRAGLARVGAEQRSERLLIVAPPGVGKSRLLAELAGAVDATVLRARVRPQGTAPYETVAQLFDGVTSDGLAFALAASDIPPARATVIAAEVRRLRDPEAEARAGTGDLAADRDARFEAWSAALDALSDRPSAWLVEDVHWAGQDLLAFLDHAGRAPSRHGRLVVATARPSLLEAAPAWCETERIDLAPLPPTDAAALVRALVGDALPETLVDAVVQRSDGTPLFIEELIRTWASVGTLVAGADGGWSLAVQPDAVVLPQTVQAIYAAQLDDLPPDARLVARRGAVAGRRVPMAALGSLELDDRRDGVEALRRRDFLAGPVSDEVTGEAYAYRHALLRDAGYASLARVERARLHVAMAAWLEAVAGERADVVAEAIAEHHASALDSLPRLASGDLPDPATLARLAAGWYERAAEAALRLSAHAAATRLLARSIELADADAGLDIARRRLRLGGILAETANLEAGVGEIEAAMRAFALSLPDEADDYARAVYALGRAYMQQIRFTEAETLLSDALDRLARAGTEDPARSRLMALHAWSVGAQGREDGVLEEARAATALAAEVDDPILQLDVLDHVTAARDEVGEVDPGAWKDMAERAIALGRWHQAVVATRVQAMIGAEHDYGAGLPLIDAAAEMAQAHGMTEQGGWCELSRAEALFVTGDWSAALEAGLRAVTLGERYAYARLSFRTWVVILPIVAARADPSLLERRATWWADASAYMPAAPSAYGRLLTGATDVWLAAAAGRPLPVPDADLVDTAMPYVNPHFRAGVEAVVGAWIAGGRTDLARAVVDRPLEDDAPPLVRASIALVRAQVELSEGNEDGALASAREAVEMARPIGATWWLARALRILGDPEADVLEASLGIRS